LKLKTSFDHIFPVTIKGFSGEGILVNEQGLVKVRSCGVKEQTDVWIEIPVDGDGVSGSLPNVNFRIDEMFVGRIASIKVIITKRQTQRPPTPLPQVSQRSNRLNFSVFERRFLPCDHPQQGPVMIFEIDVELGVTGFDVREL